MQTHPARVEVGHDAVQVDAESHRLTLDTTRRRWFARRLAFFAVAVALLAACGDGDVEAERSYSIGLEVDDSVDRYRYVATESVDIRVGDEVTFELENTGTLIHDLQVVDPEGNRVGYAPPTAPGDDTTITVLFEEAGVFRLNCLVDDHLTAHRMQTLFEVTDPDV